ncbi:MAG: peptide ABC transporter substrate-binding protein [Chloroflexota bacterium]
MLALLGLLITACGGSAVVHTSTDTHGFVARTATGCPHRTPAFGTIRYSDWQFPDTLNPFQTSSSVSAETINATQDGLFTYDSHARLTPQMATMIPSLKNGGVRDGGRTVLVHMKRGMRWSDGADITAKDVVFGWRIGMDRATGPYCGGSCDQIARIATPDRYTAIFHLKGVFAPAVPTAMPPIFPTVWKGAWANDAHRAAVRLGQDSTFNFEGPDYPTDGAYQVASFSKDDRILLHPMRYYADMNCGGSVRDLVFVFYSAKPSMIAAAATGGTDVTQDYTFADLAELRRHTDVYTIYNTPSFEFEHLEFNIDKSYGGSPNPLSNANVRLALALALDKIGLIRSALGIGKVEAQEIVCWTPWVNTPQLTQPFADTTITGQWDPLAGGYVNSGSPKALADARTLLTRTQWARGFSLTVTTTNGNPVRGAELGILENNWARVGVSVVPNFIPPSKLFSAWATGGPLNHGQFQAAIFAFQGSPEPDSFKYNFESRYIDRRAEPHSSINENYSGIDDPVFETAFPAAAGTFDEARRTREYDIIQERLNQKAYWIGLYYRTSIATADRIVQGFKNNPTSAGPTWNMYDWKVRTLS